MPNVQRACGVGRDEFHLYFIFCLDGGATIVGPRSQDHGNDFGMTGLGQGEVDKAGTCNIGFGDHVVVGQRGNELACKLSWG